MSARRVPWVGAVALVAVCAAASAALAAIVTRDYVTRDCTGTATVSEIPTDACAVWNEGGQALYVFATCNSSRIGGVAHVTTFAPSDKRCATALGHSTLPLDECVSFGPRLSQRHQCTAGASRLGALTLAGVAALALCALTLLP
jgi:hypothetical protein